MPADKVFADTNVAFYSRDEAADARVAGARRWLMEAGGRGRLCVNLQVLNELASVLFRKRKHLSNEQVFDAIDKLAVFGTTPVSLETILAARSIRVSTGYSWWDCLLLASALELDCSHFLSEDLQDGLEIGGLTIINPFLHAPEEILGPVQE
jgi:predicted nucleic acid-binding protein